MLEVKKLTVSYGAFRAVDNLSFSVNEGDWLMLVGPNGAGKSTVLAALCGSQSYEGSIIYSGKDISRMKPCERARNIGILAQNHFVGYSFSVEEVVRLGLYSHSKGFFSPRAEGSEKAVEAALEITGLLSKRQQSVLTLSGGELQRTFLAQVLAQNPRLLLLDEPANHLDLPYQKQIFSLIKDWLSEGNRAVISVVHDLSLAKLYGSRGILLNQGKAFAEGKIQDVMSDEKLKVVYGMNVADWMRTLLSAW